MSKQLYRLVYYSRNRISNHGDDHRQEIEQILATSRDNNSRCDVTGALIFNAGCFGQVLEGHLEDIEETFERIQRDERHGDVSILAMEPIEHRNFARWSMALVSALPGNDSVLASIGSQSGFDPSKLDGDELHSVLHRLLLEEEALLAR